LIEVPCNVCGADCWRLLYPATSALGGAPAVGAFCCTHDGYGSHAQIVRCRRCSHVYANPRFSPEEIIGAYESVEDGLYVRERTGRELTFRKHLRLLERRTGPAAGRRLLDVGAFIGVFVEVAKVSGWSAKGVEPSEWAVVEARGRGLDLVRGTLDDLSEESGTFDVVTMWDVIEHFHDPAAEVRKARGLLRPGGLLALHTMDIGSLVARLSRSRWPWLMDMHLHYFSRRTLARLVERAGFRVEGAHACGRYVRFEYLVSRVAALSAPAGWVLGSLGRVLGLSSAAVPVNFGDLMTLYARACEPEEVHLPAT
jgi:2-polyprenyl-3-methyl-5-hydroxy-6-metoxy-1,4-benzoquinol methylase